MASESSMVPPVVAILPHLRVASRRNSSFTMGYPLYSRSTFDTPSSGVRPGAPHQPPTEEIPDTAARRKGRQENHLGKFCDEDADDGEQAELLCSHAADQRRDAVLG